MEKISSQKMSCRKDMQCTCPMCLASFQATWDLRRPLPPNNAFQTITNLEDTFNSHYRTPTPPPSRKGKENNSPKTVGNDEKICRPISPFSLRMPNHLSPEPIGTFNSPEDNGNPQSLERKAGTKRSMWCRRLVFPVWIAFVAFVLPKVMLKLYPPALNGDEVAEIVKESRARTRLGDRFDLIQRRLSQSLRDQAVSNCTGPTAAWNLKEARFLMRSECNFFSSPAETVSVWGFPVKTSGVLGRALRHRSFTIISGRVLELIAFAPCIGTSRISWMEVAMEFVSRVDAFSIFFGNESEQDEKALLDAEFKESSTCVRLF